MEKAQEEWRSGGIQISFSGWGKGSEVSKVVPESTQCTSASPSQTAALTDTGPGSMPLDPLLPATPQVRQVPEHIWHNLSWAGQSQS